MCVVVRTAPITLLIQQHILLFEMYCSN